MLALVATLVLQDQVGAKHFIDPKKLAKPSKSILSIPKIIRNQGRAPLRVPKGFKIEPFAEGMFFPRNLAVAPNGDVFVVEAEGVRVRVLRDADGDGKAETTRLFCGGLRGPHGIAFRSEVIVRSGGDHGAVLSRAWLYIANTGNVIRYPYNEGQMKADGKPEIVVPDIPAKPGYNMHWTRNIAFTHDGSRMIVTVGSATNDDPEPFPRGCVLSYTPEGKDQKLLASGVRNPTGLAFRPGTNELWTSCIERDFMGGDTPPDYVTRIKEGQFYGWPYFYIGKNIDPRNKKLKPPRTDVTVPDLLVEAHSIPLGIAFYNGTQFPAKYQGGMFIAMRGSTNRVPRSGYKVVLVRFPNGKLDPTYEDFVVGWVPDRMKQGVFGRPAAVAVAKDGALLIADESGHTIWRVAYAG